ncbi:tetratricopeptide repeat protein [uncultured Ilyobacter sp.]|uniref:tetratricopeptide repeat protein n=1 Tax=uncultured Ilyobacter sp. TaxID=544433 RepID=UPI0029F56517|nr:tetratricopeptide repeat protein [uncultured Ilyobacter sp.]
MRTCTTTIAIALLLAVVASAQDSAAPERQRELLHKGLNAFDEAVAVAKDDPRQAHALYRQAASAFELLAATGVRSAGLEYNLGNTYFRLGELGRAIAHYRRAEQLDPTDTQIHANLEYARNRVEPFISAGGTEKLLARLQFWTRKVSVQRRFWIAAFASIAGWLGLIAWLRWRQRPVLVLGIIAILLGGANAGSVTWQLHDHATHPHAVVVDGSHVLRLGRGEGYDPALTQQLGPGVELRILRERGGWVETRLADGNTGWLPVGAIEKI